MTTDLDNILLKLWNNWTFRLSLSSNELFHSNALQYFAEILSINDENNSNQDHPSENKSAIENIVHQKILSKTTVEKLFKISGGGQPENLNIYSKFTIEREWKNMDLVVLGHNDKKRTIPVLAIEVKVKSYPTDTQLKEYKKILVDAPLILLTGMGWEGRKDVIAISFNDLANSLKEHFHDTANQLVLNYIELCSDLDSLFSFLKTKLNAELSIEDSIDIGDKLEPYRLHSIWWKLWASHIKNEIDNKLKKFEFYPTYYDSYSGYTKTGNVGAYFKWESSETDKDNRKIHIGIQIEGSSFRLFLKIVDSKLGSAKEARKCAENILLNLFKNKGVFSNHPANSHYRKHIRLITPKNGNDSNDELTIFTRDIFGTPRNGEFNLTGYANAPGDGFADFRLRIESGCKISDIVDTAVNVLSKNLYSFSTNGQLVLLDVVKAFEKSWKSNIEELKKFKQFAS